MIKAIRTIQNLGVFTGFDWDTAVRDRSSRPVYLQALNIIYGRNYSGKTTLSRIARALETGNLSDRFINPAFEVLFQDGSTVTQADPTGHSHTVRVFNEDFVRENLSVFYDEETDVAAFAVLGSDNAEVARELETKERELGSEEIAGSLVYEQEARRRERSEAQKACDRAVHDLDEQLRHKATDRTDGIKYNSLYGDPNYNIAKIRADIASVTAASYSPLGEEEQGAFRTLLQETPKDVPPELPTLSLAYDALYVEVIELLVRPPG